MRTAAILACAAAIASMYSMPLTFSRTFHGKQHYLPRIVRDQGGRFATDSPVEGAGFEPSVPRESNGENAKEPVSPLERKMPEMSSTGRRLSIFTSGFSRD